MKSNYVSIIPILLLQTFFIGSYCDGSVSPANDINSGSNENNETSLPSGDKDHQPRFGFPISYGNDLQGYNTGTATNGPLKIELGGIFLGTLIGLGAVLIAPKLAHIFSSPTVGGYSRGLNDNMMTGISSVISRIDEALEENQIDSMSCLERAACTYMQTGNQQTGPSQQLLQSNSSSSLINFVIDGSKLKAALERGLKGERCSYIYPKCSFSTNPLISGLKAMINTNSI